MNKLLLLLLTVASFRSAAQVNVTLHMDQKLAGEPFTYDRPVQADLGYWYKLTRLQYYISEIKLIHDGGIVTPVTDMYLLVDPAVVSSFDLGSFPIGTLEQIQFSIGVDSAHNHLDPSTYPNGHPLAPQNPSMHWGWISGYRFIAIEGYAGADSNSLNNNFQIHTVGEDNYRYISLDVSGKVNGNVMDIHIQADYERFLNNIDVSGGLISHAATGPSKTIADNTRSLFKAVETTAVHDPMVPGSFDISPNPASHIATLQYHFPGYHQVRCTIFDMNGHAVFARELEESGEPLELLTDWQRGIYIVRLTSKETLLAVEKLVVQ